MRQLLTRAAASLAAGLPLVSVAQAPCDGDSTSQDTARLHDASTASAASDPSGRSWLMSSDQGWPLGLLRGQAWTLPLGMPCYLPSLAVHAMAEAPLSAPDLETAYHVSLMQPLLSYMPEAATVPALTSRTLQALEAAAVQGFTRGTNLTQVVTLAWALAWAGHQPGQQYIELLHAAASGSLPAVTGQRLSTAHRAVLLWCTAMLGAVPQTVWESGLRATAAAAAAAVPGVHQGLDDCALLYLLHAALLYGTDAAPPGRRTAAAPGSSGSAVSPTSPAAASASSPACQPRVTREEVLAAAAPLGRKALAKLAAMYGEYVPLHPAIEGPYMALLYVLEELATAAGADANSRGTSHCGARETAAAAAHPSGEGAWAPPGTANQALAVLNNPKELARIRRDLLYHWRGDQSLDQVQRVRNHVVYLLSRRMGLTVAQPDDVDVAVPSRWLALFVRSGSGGAAASTATATSGGSGCGGTASGSVSHRRLQNDTLSDLEAASGEVLEVLCRDRFAPQVHEPAAAYAGAAATAAGGGGSAGGTTGSGSAGMWAARVRQLQRLGWRVVVVNVGWWQGLGSDAEREAYLLRVLRGRSG